MPVLALTGITKRFGMALALDGAGITLRGGEVHALMGENGAGKSTLIQLLAGLLRTDAGVVTLDGARVALTGPAEASALGLRFLHQEMQVVPGVSVAENLYLGRAIPSRFGLVRWRAMRQGAAAALRRLGLDHIDPALPMARLGPGDQMLVRIAATLVGGGTPWLYVMDEPTASLSQAEAERLFVVIAGLKAEGAGVLYVSHRMEEVLRLADRITVLRDGAVVARHDRGAADQARLIHDMTGRSLQPGQRRVGVADAALVQISGLAAGALQQLDLTLARGEIVGIAGLAGSGRNAALKALIGALPRRGQVRLDGKALAQTPAAVWAQGVAYVPRERRAEGLMPWRALSETVVLPHLRAVQRGGFLRRRVEQALVRRLSAAVRLKARGPAQMVGQLSGGNQQKLLFARAIAGQPRLLLLDEPTRGVDVAARFDLHDLIRGLADNGVGVVLASSDLAELIALCDRIVVLHQGVMTGILPAAGLTEAALLAALYAGDPQTGAQP